MAAPRLAELLGSLSLATDAAAGLALENALRPMIGPHTVHGTTALAPSSAVGYPPVL